MAKDTNNTAKPKIKLLKCPPMKQYTPEEIAEMNRTWQVGFVNNSKPSTKPSKKS